MDSRWLHTKRKIEALASQYPIEESSDDIVNSEVFISHSRSDKTFVMKVLAFLKYSKGGIGGYVDWRDASMPSVTNAETAMQLKARIESARKVIYVVTNESLKSVWCSWELGFADKAKGTSQIAILAIKPNNGKWKNNEFLQQYPWITYDIKTDLFQVHLVNGDTLPLYDWIRNQV